jgi:hypothetical protein
VKVTFVPWQIDPDGLAEIVTLVGTLEVTLTTTVSLFEIPELVCEAVRIYVVVAVGEAIGLLEVEELNPVAGLHE